MSISGYWAFGINVADNVLLTPALKSTVPNGLIIAADFFVIIHVLGSFQVYSMPVPSPGPVLQVHVIASVVIALPNHTVVTSADPYNLPG